MTPTAENRRIEREVIATFNPPRNRYTYRARVTRWYRRNRTELAAFGITLALTAAIVGYFVATIALAYRANPVGDPTGFLVWIWSVTGIATSLWAAGRN